MNMNGMNFESKRQELARRLVDREVYYCVSSLVSTLSVLAQNCGFTVLRDECLSWEDDILPLLEWIDYDEALRQYVMDDADLDDLESLVEECGYWNNLVDASGYTTYLSEFDPTPEKGEADEFSEWIDAEQGRESKFREAVADFLLANGDAQELCQTFDVCTDDYRGDVYEHWIVSRWLAARLESRGEVTGEICNLVIWGRTCTGQSISLDRVIQNIAIELWQEEWDEFVKSQENITC